MRNSQNSVTLSAPELAYVERLAAAHKRSVSWAIGQCVRVAMDHDGATPQPLPVVPLPDMSGVVRSYGEPQIPPPAQRPEWQTDKGALADGYRIDASGWIVRISDNAFLHQLTPAPR